MTFVESCVVEGELYEYDNFEHRVLLSPFGSFKFDTENRFRGPIVPFQARRFCKEDKECVDDSFSMNAYMADESLFIPANEVNEYDLGTAYVINGKNLITLGNAEFMQPNVLGGKRSNEQVIEVYTHAYPNPYSVEDRMEPDLVRQQTVSELFKKNTFEIVRPI